MRHGGSGSGASSCTGRRYRLPRCFRSSRGPRNWWRCCGRPGRWSRRLACTGTPICTVTTASGSSCRLVTASCGMTRWWRRRTRPKRWISAPWRRRLPGCRTTHWSTRCRAGIACQRSWLMRPGSCSGGWSRVTGGCRRFATMCTVICVSVTAAPARRRRRGRLTRVASASAVTSPTWPSRSVVRYRSRPVTRSATFPTWMSGGA